MKNIPRPASDCPPVDDELLCEVGAFPAVVPVAKAQCLCTDVRKVEFKKYCGLRLIFTFEIVDPIEFARTTLHMFCRIKTSWKRPPISSKLFQTVAVACPSGIGRRQRITKTLFVGGVYECGLRDVAHDGVKYTIIEKLLRRLTS
jgi:hypothetical protein